MILFCCFAENLGSVLCSHAIAGRDILGRDSLPRVLYFQPTGYPENPPEKNRPGSSLPCQVPVLDFLAYSRCALSGHSARNLAMARSAAAGGYAQAGRGTSSRSEGASLKTELVPGTGIQA